MREPTTVVELAAMVELPMCSCSEREMERWRRAPALVWSERGSREDAALLEADINGIMDGRGMHAVLLRERDAAILREGGRGMWWLSGWCG